MPDIDKAIAIAQKLRSLLIQVIAVEKEWAEYEQSDEASDKKIKDVLSTFDEGKEAMVDWNKSDDLAAAWGKMTDRERQAYFKKVEKLNKKSRAKRSGKKRTNLKEQDDAPATDLLAQIDQLIYDLMDYEGGGDRWVDADDIESKEVLKLKEIIAQDDQFKLKKICLALAA